MYLSQINSKQNINFNDIINNVQDQYTQNLVRRILQAISNLKIQIQKVKNYLLYVDKSLYTLELQSKGNIGRLSSAYPRVLLLQKIFKNRSRSFLAQLYSQFYELQQLLYQLEQRKEYLESYKENNLEKENQVNTELEQDINETGTGVNDFEVQRTIEIITNLISNYFQPEIIYLEKEVQEIYVKVANIEKRIKKLFALIKSKIAKMVIKLIVRSLLPIILPLLPFILLCCGICIAILYVFYNSPISDIVSVEDAYKFIQDNPSFIQHVLK